MIPLDGLSLEHEHHDDRENRKGHDLLDHLELKQVEWASVALETDAVGGHGETVFEKRNTPRKQDDHDERPSC